MTSETPSLWQQDMAAGAIGFHELGGQFGLLATIRKSDTLYVGFDDLSRAGLPKQNREGFGAKFAAANGWSHMGVLAFSGNWYRDPELHKKLQAMADQGFFRSYERVIMSGISMGGFAACAFAPLAPGCTVISFSPQSTLSAQFAEWDHRYRRGSAQDWSGPFSDAAQGVAKAGRAWIIYDPKIIEDKKHAARICGNHVTHLRTRYSGHATAQFLQQIDLLKQVSSECADGTMSETRFYSLYRKARNTRRFLLPLMHSVIADGKPERVEALSRIMQQFGRIPLAKNAREEAKKLREAA